MALTHLRGFPHVLEVGCGRGNFLKRAHQAGHAVVGIDLNHASLKAASEQGLSVAFTDVQTLARQQPGRYDAIVAFQVLEHTPDPRGFLEDLLHLLRPGGRLVLAVPNPNGWLRLDEHNLLNQPPHHMTRWVPETFQRLPALFPLSIVSVESEPLAQDQVDYYLTLQLRRVVRIHLAAHYLARLPNATVGRWLRSHHPTRARLAGHALLICLEKTAS